jgi:hypothetical protein
VSLIDKLGTKAAAIIGEPVLALALVVPPGATLYKAYAPKSKGSAVAGPIFAAIASKAQGQPEGMAGRMPRQQGLLALTGSNLVFLKKKKLGGDPAEVLVQWPRSDISEMSYELGDKWNYPGLALSFSDGTACAVFGEKKWGLDQLANAAG